MSGIEALRDAQVAAAQMEEVGRRIERWLPQRKDSDLDGVVQRHAVGQTQSLAAEAEALRAEWTSVHDEITSLREGAREGAISAQEAARRLADLRRRLPLLRARTASVSTTYGTVSATLQDPAARREALLAKYPSLRR